ncbi:MAG: DUF5017 domain-containing protein [Alistipes sp.]|nr:DUF5017 domain-containing protein [Alistipes sp.]
MKRIFVILTAVMLLAGCRKGEVETPKFGVRTASKTVRAGVPVVFDFEGTADIISFYSGETGNEYAYHDRDRIIPTDMVVTFSTVTTTGNIASPNPVKVPILCSTDFAGGDEYTVEAVEAATWTDISDRFRMPTGTDQTVFSGDVSILDLFPDNETPLYLCFHYYCDKFDSARNNLRTVYNIQSFRVNGVTDAGSSILYPFADCNWKMALGYPLENEGVKPDINTTRVLMRCDFRPASDRDSYFIAGPFYRHGEINTGPDMAVGIKSISTPMLASYRHTYEKAGKYTVTFVASNASVYGRRQVVRTMDITVVDDGGTIVPPENEEWND